jgi:hypothetical protein
MKKVQQNQLNKLLESLAKVNKTNVDELKEAVLPLYSQENLLYNGTAVYNFFQFRIKPYLEKGEKPEQFDSRYREWKFKICAQCLGEFAYAWHYDGVKFCCLECLDNSLQDVGLKVTRGRDLRLRYGTTSAPAIVDSSTLTELKNLYSDRAADAFV